jgi:predicted Zn finger-like uncharacterized protein
MPAQRIACPSCQAVLQVGDHLRGKQVRCPKCQGTILVPDGMSAPAVAAAPANSNQWYLARDKKKLGPFSPAQVRQMAAAGQIGPDDMLLRDGAPKWISASSIKGLFSSNAVAAAPAPTPATRPAPRTEEEEEYDDQPARRKAVKRSGFPLGLVLAGGGGLAAVVLGAVLIWFFAFRDSGRSGPLDSNQRADQGGDKGGDGKKDFNTAFLADHFVAAIIVHPQRMLESKALASQSQNKLFEQIPMKELDPRKMERIVVYLAPDAAGNPESGGGFVVQYSEAVDIKKQLCEQIPQTREANHQGKTYLRFTPPGSKTTMGAYTPDDKTLVGASESNLQQMLAAKDAKSPLAKQLAQVDLNNDIVAVFAVEPIRPMLKEMLKDSEKSLQGMPQFANVRNLPDYLQFVTLKINLSADNFLQIDLEATDAKAAKEVFKLTNAGSEFLKMVIEKMQMDMQKDMPPELSKSVAAFSDDLIKGIDVNLNGTRVTATMKTPKNTAELISKLGPMFEQMMPGPPMPPRK